MLVRERGFLSFLPFLGGGGGGEGRGGEEVLVWLLFVVRFLLWLLFFIVTFYLRSAYL